jgi:hypothetical protein
MVEIRIVVEGGVIPHENDSATTINNSEKLREAFYKLLSKMVNPEQFNLIIEIGAGELYAANSFKKYANVDKRTSMLVDLDGPRTTKEHKLKYLEIDDFSETVFFMVQEMEAWILSQPDVILKCYQDRYIRKKANVNFEQTESLLFQIHPEEIKKPADKLKVLLGRYYAEMKGNVEKKKKYGKLKDAPLLIENLDISRLIDTFDDMESLMNHIELESVGP